MDAQEWKWSIPDHWFMQVHPPPPSDWYMITTDTPMYKQSLMSTIGSYMHQKPKNINHQEDIKNVSKII